MSDKRNVAGGLAGAVLVAAMAVTALSTLGGSRQTLEGELVGCDGTGGQHFESGSLRCWNPWPDGDVNGAYSHDSCIGTWSDGEVDRQGIILKPDADWLLEGVEWQTSYEDWYGSPLYAKLYAAGDDDWGDPGALLAASGDVSGQMVEISWWEPPGAGWMTGKGVNVHATFPAPVRLEQSETYWLLFESPDLDCDSTYHWYDTHSFDTPPLPAPSWYGGVLFCSPGCYSAPPDSLQVPVALYGALVSGTPTATPTATPLGGLPPTPGNTPTPHGTPNAWITEILASQATPCVDWNLRRGCGVNDEYVEVGAHPAQSLAGYELGVHDESAALVCSYDIASDNLTGPVKTYWADMMTAAAGGICAGLPITGTAILTDSLGVQLDSRLFWSSGGQSWAAHSYNYPGGSWTTATPSPGR
jgi:hypothetical protein